MSYFSHWEWRYFWLAMGFFWMFVIVIFLLAIGPLETWQIKATKHDIISESRHGPHEGPYFEAHRDVPMVILLEITCFCKDGERLTKKGYEAGL